MSNDEIQGWDRLRHGGLLLDAQRFREVAAAAPEPLFSLFERELRKRSAAMLDDGDAKSADIADFASFVMRQICGFSESTGNWQRGPQVPPEWGRVSITGETVKPRQLWEGHRGGVLPIFIDREKRVGIGRGRKATSQVLQWLRAGDEQLALVTNGRQWRLVFAGLDFDAWCEWDLDLWLEEGELSAQVTALRTLLQPVLWTPKDKGAPPPLLQAVLDSRKGQAELSQVLGERVREAVEILVQSHGEGLKQQCSDVDPADIYRAAVRIVMRMVVVLFAESREMLPRDNALYHGAYGLGGLLEDLEKVAARGGNRLARSSGAWPRVLALFRLVHEGSHHPSLPVPAYGGELFAKGDAYSSEGLVRALAVFENACFEHEVLPDRDVHRILDHITRTRVKLRQGRVSTWVPAPVDFSDLSSEYIGILYEGLLDFELKTAPSGDPVIFLAVGNQPALPLSRLEEMDDKALKDLLEQMKDTSTGDEGESESEEDEDEETTDAEEVAADAVGKGETSEEGDAEAAEEQQDDDERYTTRTRAEVWARRAAEVGNLVRKPRGKLTPETRLAFEETVARKARQLVTRVVLPGEWYLVRWGGTRKGSGTFYTRPGLAVPTVQRTLRPLAWNAPAEADGTLNRDAPPTRWSPKKPEEILDLKVVDPACGSGTFPVAALRFLTDALYASLYHHKRIHEQGDRAVVALLKGPSDQEGIEERLCEELLPCRPDDELFEQRLKAVLRRHVVERCIYGVDLDPLAVELCRLALWVETMDRTLPFSFLDHKVKCGNGLVGAWFDQFQHYPAMAWKNREGGDKGHSNGVHFKKESRTKAIKAFVKDTLQQDLATHLLHHAWAGVPPSDIHDDALAVLEDLHAMPVVDASERARLYRERLLGSDSWQQLKAAFDRWCACWFWPADQLDCAPLPSSFAAPSEETLELVEALARSQRFFHWELEFPDVFQTSGAGFHAVLGNPPWETLQPNSKEYFSNVDPLYRSYGKQEALRHQAEYFQAEATEREWLNYTEDFANSSNWVKFIASPFGDPEIAEKPIEKFSLARGHQNMILHDEWRKSRSGSHGYADPMHPFCHCGDGKAYTYKLFLEQAHALLRNGGRLGFIVPSGLYSDHGTAALRELFLDRCRWEWLFGFENREKIFDIDSRFKFNAIIIEKGGQTEAIHTAFMRRKLEDWEHAESLVTLYGRENVERFSPRSKAILEIQSARDLEILQKIYANSVLLGDDGPDGWGITYNQGDFNMTSDSKLFPPRPKWEDEGHRPDEYSRWLKGDWRPIEELWTELGVEGLREEERRSAQPPYDTLPIPRADLPEGVVLSREADAWLQEGGIRATAVPLYEGRMVNLFDFSEKGWVSGKGRKAEWRSIEWRTKEIDPQYLMDLEVYSQSRASGSMKLGFLAIGSATNMRTMYCAALPDLPCGNSVGVLRPRPGRHGHVLLVPQLTSLLFDYVVRLRLTGLNLNFFVIDETPLPEPTVSPAQIGNAASLSLPANVFAAQWLQLRSEVASTRAWKLSWASAPAERIRLKAILDALAFATAGLGVDSCYHLLRDCDWANPSSMQLDPKGFWRVDKEKDPELRHTILTLVALLELQEHIERCGGDRQKGILSFCTQNDGAGWMLPEAIRLSDYELGHDERANEPQPVASRLGSRFFDWQLAQDVDESWRECHLHARNLLGESGYQQLLEDIEHETSDEPKKQTDSAGSEPIRPSSQGTLFE